LLSTLELTKNLDEIFCRFNQQQHNLFSFNNISIQNKFI
jgi:hypothetical protein